jgi:hypothetical protein
MQWSAIDAAAAAGPSETADVDRRPGDGMTCGPHSRLLDPDEKFATWAAGQVNGDERAREIPYLLRHVSCAKTSCVFARGG